MFSFLPNYPFLEIIWWGNTIEEYLVALAVLVISLFVLGIVRSFIFARLRLLAQKTKTNIDDLVVRILKSIRPPFYVVLSLYIALLFLEVHPFIDKAILAIVLVWATYQVILAIQLVVDFILDKKIDPEDGGQRAAIGLLSTLVRIALWVIGIILILQNLGVNVSSFIAGLGIGGVAVALALQNVLGDLFSSFAIYFDKPFTVGDFIIVGDKMGTVEKIGVKTTRLRALQGEEIVLSNTDLTSAQVQNFRKLNERRVTFTFGVTYDTPSDKLKAIPSIIENIFNDLDMVRYESAHFKEFADSALVFEVIYYTLSPEYLEYLSLRQKINLAIVESFDREKIEMAFPTQTVYLRKEV